MANREVSLFLKYPGPPVALQRLEHSFLECVIEYKSGAASELQRLPPAQLRSHYQLKGTTTLVDDELVVQFVPKHAGLHTVRIFGDTRELCRPVAFIVNQNCEVESTPYDRPVKMASSFFHVSAQNSSTQLPQQQVGGRPPSLGQGFASQRQSGVVLGIPQSQQQYSPVQFSPPAAPYRQNENVEGLGRGFMSDPSLSYPGPSSPQTSPQHYGALSSPQTSPQHFGAPGNQQRYSYLSSKGLNSRPTSMSPADEAAFAGDLFTTKPDQSTFNQLHTAKRAGQTVYGRRRPFMAVNHDSVVTPDTFRMLEKDIDFVVTGGHTKGKKRCTICSKKVKATKAVELGEENYCEPCFRRQFLLRSAIEHFMVPSIQECTVEVPVNKKATKFVSARKTIPNVNLRGLEPNEVKFALQEFRKFSTDANGWINKAVLLPLMKACFTYSLTDNEIKALLSGQALQSVIKSFGINERDEVHEIEFLSLVAFVARERQRVRSSADPKTRFTGADLQMAYAFRNHFGAQGEEGIVRSPPVRSGPGQIAPTDRFRTSSAPPTQGNFSQVPLRNRDSLMQQQQLRESQLLPRSPTDTSINVPSSTHVQSSPNTNPLMAGPNAALRSPTSQMSPMSPMSPQNPLGFSAQPPSQYDFSQLQQPHAQPTVYGGMSTRASAFSESANLSLQPASGGGMGDLPEEDQEENELPTLPRNKDPSGQTITNPLLSKRPPNSKQMMEELKLTGGSADSWMLY